MSPSKIEVSRRLAIRRSEEVAQIEVIIVHVDEHVSDRGIEVPVDLVGVKRIDGIALVVVKFS